MAEVILEHRSWKIPKSAAARFGIKREERGLETGRCWAQIPRGVGFSQSINWIQSHRAQTYAQLKRSRQSSPSQDASVSSWRRGRTGLAPTVSWAPSRVWDLNEWICWNVHYYSGRNWELPLNKMCSVVITICISFLKIQCSLTPFKVLW